MKSIGIIYNFYTHKKSHTMWLREIKYLQNYALIFFSRAVVKTSE